MLSSKSIPHISSILQSDILYRLVPNSRSHPLHLHIVNSLISLVKHTKTYVPLAPYIIPILTSTLNASSRPKASTLKPLDLDVHIRVPQQYVRTRVLSEGLTEEAVFLLAEWLATPSVHGSISFPEIIVPIVVQLRKSVKSSNLGPGKEPTMVKQLLDRIDESGKWVELKRKTVSFAPGRLGEVKDWETSFTSKVDESPLGKYLKVQRKTREKRRELLEKVQYLFILLLAGTDGVFRQGKVEMRYWTRRTVTRPSFRPVRTTTRSNLLSASDISDYIFFGATVAAWGITKSRRIALCNIK